MKHSPIKIVNAVRGQRVASPSPAPPDPGGFQSQLDTLKASVAAQQAQIDQKTSQDDVVNLIGARAACNCGSVDDLQLTVSNPPTQAEMQALADKLREVMFALKGE